MSNITMDAKKLRALAKEAGIEPRKTFRLSPPQLAEALKEVSSDYEDVETWDNTKADECIKKLKSSASNASREEKEESQESEESIVEEESKPLPLVTPDKPTKQISTKKSTPKKEKKSAVKETQPSETSREKPSKRRPKKNKNNAVPGVSNSEDVMLVNANVETLQADVEELKSQLSETQEMLRQTMLFFTWWHNKYLNEDPEPEILGIDWESVIKEQLTNL